MSRSSREYFDQIENIIENNMNDIDKDAELHAWANAQINFTPNANFDLHIAKESFIPQVERFIEIFTDGVKNGELKALHAFAIYKRLEKMFDKAKFEVESLAITEAEKEAKTFTICEVEFTSREGSKSLNYNEDFLINELHEKIKQRQNLIKVASASKEPIYDADGIEVTKCSVKPSKSSLAVKFKTK
jgi:hypothetical protein